MKKLLSLILTAQMAFMLSISASAAYTFDTGLIDYESLVGDSATTAALQDLMNDNLTGTSNPFENANKDTVKSTITPITWSEDSGYTAFGTSVKLYANASNAALRIQFGSTFTDNFYSEFDVMRADTAGVLNYELRTNQGSSSASEYILQFTKGNKVSFLGREVCSYDTEKWYNVKLWFNFAEGYGRLEIKENGATEWNSYDGFLFAYDTSAGAQRVQIGYTGISSTTESTSYIDNLRAMTTTDAVVPTLNSYGDDFDGTLTYASSVSDWSNQWHGENFGEKATAETAALSGYDGKVLKLSTSQAVTATLAKRPFTLATTPNVRHNIKFKLGGNVEDGGAKVFRIETSDPARTDSTIASSNKVDLFHIQNQTLYVMGSSKGGIKLETGKLYDCEFIYDAAAKIARISVNDRDGKQYVYDLSSDTVFGTADTDWRLLSCAAFRLKSTASYPEAVMYVDDFEWNVLDTGKFASTGAVIKSGLTDSANMDETIVYSFNQTAEKTEDALANAVVTVNGEVATWGYRIVAADEAVELRFRNLDPATEYTIELSGIKNLAGEDLAEAIAPVTFTTNEWDVKVENDKPTVDANGDVSAKIAAAYADGKAMMIIAAAYDANDKLVDVVMDEVTVTSRDAAEFTLDTAFDGEYSYVTAYIWSDFNQMIPFAYPATNQ